jgi:hypothetical protein
MRTPSAAVPRRLPRLHREQGSRRLQQRRQQSWKLRAGVDISDGKYVPFSLLKFFNAQIFFDLSICMQ